MTSKDEAPFFVVDHNAMLGKEAWMWSEETKWCTMKKCRFFVISGEWLSL